MFKKYFFILSAILLSNIAAQIGYAQEGEFKIENFSVSIEKSGKAANLRDKAMRKATKDGFLQLLKRITPRYVWTRHDDVLATVDPDRLLLKSSIISEDQTKGYNLTVDLFYDRAETLNILKASNIPFSERTAEKTLMLAIFKGDSRKEVLWEQENPWRDALKNEAEEAGMSEIVFPSGDIEEVTSLTPQMAMVGAEDIIYNISKNYSAKQAIVASVEVKYGFVGRVLDLQANLYGKEGTKPFYIRLPYGDEITLEQALSQAANAFYSKLEEDLQKDSLVEVDRPDRIYLRYRPMTLSNLIALEKKLDTMDRIRQFKQRVVSIEDSIFQVDFYGDKEKFRTELEKAGLTVIPTSMAMVWGVEQSGVENQ